MRANTNRANATAFDGCAEVYDVGRRRMRPELVERALRVAGLGRGSRVLEVGAGTGQLTGALLMAGLEVVAVEPGARMRGMLSDRFPQLQVRAGFFEDQPVDPGGFDGIVGANSWHWVDPARGYPSAASLLGDRGALLFWWTFARLDPGLQARLNEQVFTGPYANHRRDPVTFDGYVEDITAAGRAEITDSGHFTVTWWQSVDDHYEVTVGQYVDYLRSFADIASLAPADQADLADRVTAVVDDATVAVTDRAYQVVAHKQR